MQWYIISKVIIPRCVRSVQFEDAFIGQYWLHRSCKGEEKKGNST